MLETILVITVLIPILAGVAWFWSAYSARIGALGNARAVGWTLAFSGCTDVAGSSLTDPRHGLPSVAAEGAVDISGDLSSDDTFPIPSEDTKDGLDASYAELLALPGYESVESESTASVGGERVIRLDPRQLSLRSHVTCNAVPDTEARWSPSIDALVAGLLARGW